MASSATTTLSYAVRQFIDRHTYTDPSLDPSDECPICLETYRFPRELCTRIVGIPGCSHTFGLDCIKHLLSTDPESPKNCPMCRTQWLPASTNSSSYRYPWDPRLPVSTATPSRIAHSTRYAPLASNQSAPHSELEVINALHPDMADHLRLLQLRETVVALQADIVRADEREVWRRQHNISARENTLSQREAAATAREDAVTAREQGMQHVINLTIQHFDETRLHVARQQNETLSLLARQQEELVRAFGEAQIGVQTEVVGGARADSGLDD